MKIYSCFVFALLLVSYTLALEKSQPQTANENVKGAVDKVEPASGGWGGGGGGGGGCHHGCCYKGHYGCQKCCSSPEEAKAVAEKKANAEKSQPETANEVADKVEPAGGGGGGGGHWGGGGGGGGGCNHGCCYSGHYGCQRCCASPEEAKAVSQKQAHAEKSQPATTNEKMEGAADKVEPAGGGGGNWNGGGGGHWGGGGGSGGGGGHWGGGGGGGGCRHGCCGGGGYGCQRCCSSPEEAKAVAAKQVHP